VSYRKLEVFFNIHCSQLHQNRETNIITMKREETFCCSNSLEEGEPTRVSQLIDFPQHD